MKLVQRSFLTSKPAAKQQQTRHISSSCHNQQSNKGRESNEGNNDKQDNDNDKKMQSMLAKALIWMFTGYMLVTLVALMFPSGNQPEVVRYSTFYHKIFYFESAILNFVLF